MAGSTDHSRTGSLKKLSASAFLKSNAWAKLRRALESPEELAFMEIGRQQSYPGSFCFTSSSLALGEEI